MGGGRGVCGCVWKGEEYMHECCERGVECECVLEGEGEECMGREG